MKITDVAIRLESMPRHDPRVRAFASITIDEVFVVWDLKVLCLPPNDRFVVAMPTSRYDWCCHACDWRNHLKANFCNRCGTALLWHRGPRDRYGREQFFRDVAHPIDRLCRQELDQTVLAAYHKAEQLEVEKNVQMNGHLPPAQFEDGVGEPDVIRG